uniref:Thioesterase n=1 Tax=uncultured bacterium AR_412 TaxID=1630013 RepID=A0A0E3JNP1_9BACT|nr:thioesterase [uncultured bacterium AR_412]
MIRGLWYQLQTTLPLSGNLGAALGVAGINELGGKFSRVYNANVRAMLRYVPRQAGCAAVIFKTGLTERMRRRVHREAAGMYQRLRVVGVPGDHHSVLLPRHAAALAARVRESLDD